MLVATALVLLMTPALAFFYGGLVRSKNALNTMMMSFSALGFVGIAWAVVGYSLAFAPGNALVGDLSHLFLRGVGLEPNGTIPHLLFMCYQATFCIITAALISGAIVERMRFSAYLTFITLWSIVVYCPIAHWVWGGGWLSKLGALDFAGGTVVHVNAGTAALVAALTRRQTSRLSVLVAPPAQRAVHAARRRPAVVRLVRLQRRQRARRQRHRRARVHGDDARAGGDARRLDVARRDPLAASRRRSAVRPRSSSDSSRSRRPPATSGRSRAIALGALAAFASYFALSARARTSLDDSLDVVAAHGVGGIVGALLTGVFAQKAFNGVADGLLFGNPAQLGIQAIAVAASIVYSGVLTFLLLKIIGAVSRCARPRTTRLSVSTSRSTAKMRTFTRKADRTAQEPTTS